MTQSLARKPGFQPVNTPQKGPIALDPEEAEVELQFGVLKWNLKGNDQYLFK